MSRAAAEALPERDRLELCLARRFYRLVDAAADRDKFADELVADDVPDTLPLYLTEDEYERVRATAARIKARSTREP